MRQSHYLWLPFSFGGLRERKAWQGLAQSRRSSLFSIGMFIVRTCPSAVHSSIVMLFAWTGIMGMNIIVQSDIRAGMAKRKQRRD